MQTHKGCLVESQRTPHSCRSRQSPLGNQTQTSKRQCARLQKKNFLRVIPTLTHSSDMVSDIPSGSIYGSDILSAIYSDILSGILTGILSVGSTPTPQPPELAIWWSGPGTLHRHRSSRYDHRVQAWPTASRRAEMTQEGETGKRSRRSISSTLC